MRDSIGNSSTLFCEQVSTVTSLFEKWNDCERSVVIYALLKRLRYPSLKFLQHSIENNLTQNLGLQSNMTTCDVNANNPLHLQQLINAYRRFPVSEMTDLIDKEPIYYGSDLFLKTDGRVYSKREDILNDILEMLPLLRPGNEEAKVIYLSLIPNAVEDTVRQIVSTELVQQIFSYLLIHPAISNEDRRSLSHWLRHLEEHIQSSFASAGQQSFYVLSNNADGCLSNSSTSVSSSVGSVASRNAWQAIAPPQPSVHKSQQLSKQQVSTNNDKTDWNLNLPNIPDKFCDNFDGIKLNDLGSSQHSLGLHFNGSSANVAANCSYSSSNQLDNVNGNANVEDHHASFSKNGIEIVDFDSNCDSNIGSQIAFRPLPNACDQFNENRWGLDDKNAYLKTRRSNSLTTAVTTLASSNNSIRAVNDSYSNSSENLAQFSQKPRSFSLSIENPRKSLISTGSDTRLDDLKPNYLKFTTHNTGMSNIGQWLKSLRLHKYVDIFKDMSYEEMLEITEVYLQSLGVTKGASHKLALCIDKLKERESNLAKIERDLLSGQIKVQFAIEELANIVLTPMKPADQSADNIAFSFIKTLELVCCALIEMDTFCIQDEESISILIWVLEKAINGEAFHVYSNQLKDLKFKVSKLKMSFGPKSHHSKPGNNCNTSKPRWNCKSRKSDQKSGSTDKANRKNSNELLNLPLNCTQQHVTVLRNLNKCNTSKGTYPEYKSSSYPNFKNGVSTSGHSFHTIKSQVNPMFVPHANFASPSLHQQVNNQQQRRSLNNLIVVSPGQGSKSGSNTCVIGSSNDEKSGNQVTAHSTSNRIEQIDLQKKQTMNIATNKSLEKVARATVELEHLAKLNQHFAK